MKELIHQTIQIILEITLVMRYDNYIQMVEDDEMDVARKLETYTIDDIYALPDGERAEIIDGQIY